MPSSERCSIRAFSFLRTRPPSRCSFSLCSGKRPEPWLPKNGAPPSPTFNFSFPNVSPPAERKLHRKSDSLDRSNDASSAVTCASVRTRGTDASLHSAIFGTACTSRASAQPIICRYRKNLRSDVAATFIEPGDQRPPRDRQIFCVTCNFTRQVGVQRRGYESGRGLGSTLWGSGLWPCGS